MPILSTESTPSANVLPEPILTTVPTKNTSSNAFTLIHSSNLTVRKRKQTSVAGYLPKQLTFDVKKKIDQNVLKMFVKDFQPFKIVEDAGFKEFVKILNPN